MLQLNAIAGACARLQNNLNLQVLGLAWNTFSPRAAKSLAVGIAQSQSLVSLDVSHCGLGDDGGSHVMGALAGKRKTSNCT